MLEYEGRAVVADRGEEVPSHSGPVEVYKEVFGR
jgi:hypothetical protein